VKVGTADFATAFLISGTVVVLWIANFTACIPWGDDWAGYLLQARAIAAGNPLAELLDNKRTIEGSDVQLGPYAYPWGYPALLASVGALAGWEVTTLKVLGVVALVVSTAGGYAIARQFFSVPVACACTLLATAQTPLLVNALIVASDASFLALSTLSLLGIVRAYRAWHSGRPSSVVELVWLSLASVAAFSIRSNGVVAACTVLCCIVTVAAYDRRSVPALFPQAVVYLALFATLTWGYFLTFPDGSLSHLEELSGDPRVWVGQLVNHSREFSLFFPFSVLEGQAKLVLLLPFLALALIGAFTSFLTYLPLTVWTLGHLAIVTVFPHSGGPRYFFPILLPLLLLAALGFSALVAGLAGALGHLAKSSRVQTVSCAFVTAAAVYSASMGLTAFRLSCEGKVGPFSESTTALVSFLQHGVADSAQIAFRKPRALRYLSGHQAFAVQDPENLNGIDFYVFDRAGLDNQVPEQTILASGDFSLISEIGSFRIYRRRK
jgi:hypothetical protein